MMQKMVVLSKCCSVRGIPGLGKLMLGRGCPYVERGKEDFTDDQQMIVP